MSDEVDGAVTAPDDLGGSSVAKAEGHKGNGARPNKSKASKAKANKGGKKKTSADGLAASHSTNGASRAEGRMASGVDEVAPPRAGSGIEDDDSDADAAHHEPLEVAPGPARVESGRTVSEPEASEPRDSEPRDSETRDSETRVSEPEVSQTEVSEPEKSSARARAGSWIRSNPVACILGFLCVALVVALIITLVAWSGQNSVSSARTTALSTARVYAVELGGYDYRHLDQDFAKVMSNSTPSFRRSFNESSDGLKSTLVKYDATSVAKVVSAGLESATASRAVALVLLDQTISNSTQKTPTTDRSQLEITLVSSGGKWLIDDVTLI